MWQFSPVVFLIEDAIIHRPKCDFLLGVLLKAKRKLYTFSHKADLAQRSDQMITGACFTHYLPGISYLAGDKCTSIASSSWVQHAVVRCGRDMKSYHFTPPEKIMK